MAYKTVDSTSVSEASPARRLGVPCFSLPPLWCNKR